MSGRQSLYGTFDVINKNEGLIKLIRPQFCNKVHTQNPDVITDLENHAQNSTGLENFYTHTKVISRMSDATQPSRD